MCKQCHQGPVHVFMLAKILLQGRHNTHYLSPSLIDWKVHIWEQLQLSLEFSKWPFVWCGNLLRWLLQQCPRTRFFWRGWSSRSSLKVGKLFLWKKKDWRHAWSYACSHKLWRSLALRDCSWWRFGEAGKCKYVFSPSYPKYDLPFHRSKHLAPNCQHQ